MSMAAVCVRILCGCVTCESQEPQAASAWQKCEIRSAKPAWDNDLRISDVKTDV
jgi:hypothetical protein